MKNKTKKTRNGFTKIPNNVLDNKNLSALAKVIYFQLLSNKAEFKVFLSEFRKNRNEEGEKYHTKAIKELMLLDMIKRKKVTTKEGKFTYEYSVVTAPPIPRVADRARCTTHGVPRAVDHAWQEACISNTNEIILINNTNEIRTNAIELMKEEIFSKSELKEKEIINPSESNKIDLNEQITLDTDYTINSEKVSEKPLKQEIKIFVTELQQEQIEDGLY